MKLKVIFSILAITLITLPASAQKYMTRSGHVWFYSHTPVEDIKAHNYQTSSILVPSSGDLAFSMLIKGFQFEKALMQEHFNEKYMESEKYPKATFKGKIVDIDQLNLSEEGTTHSVKVKGSLSIHGVTKEIESMATLKIEKDKINATADFKLLLSDYAIKIPGVVRDNIAESIDVHVIMDYSLM